MEVVSQAFAHLFCPYLGHTGLKHPPKRAHVSALFSSTNDQPTRPRKHQHTTKKDGGSTRGAYGLFTQHFRARGVASWTARLQKRRAPPPPACGYGGSLNTRRRRNHPTGPSGVPSGTPRRGHLRPHKPYGLLFGSYRWWGRTSNWEAGHPRKQSMGGLKIHQYSTERLPSGFRLR